LYKRQFRAKPVPFLGTHEPPQPQGGENRQPGCGAPGLARFQKAVVRKPETPVGVCLTRKGNQSLSLPPLSQPVVWFEHIFSLIYIFNFKNNQ
jgi:hypothetical protein